MRVFIWTVVVLLFTASNLAAAVPSFPTSFGNSYSTFVAYSNYERGYTISHKEYSNGNRYRFEAGNITIGDVQNNTLYMYDARTPSNCNSYTGVTNEMFVPSYQLISKLILGVNFTFTNYNTVRGINCTVFQNQSSSSSINNVTTSVTIDKNANVSSIQSVSGGLCLQGINVTSLNISAICKADPILYNVTCTFTNVTDGSTMPNCTFSVSDTTVLQSFVGSNSTLTLVSQNITSQFSQLMTFYLDQTARFPVRYTTISNFTRGQQNSIGNSEIDWINWIETKDLQTSLFNIPAVCPVSNSSFNPFSTSLAKSIGKSPATIPTDATGIPLGYSLVLEQEMSNSPVSTLVWNYDIRQNYQTIEYQNAVGGDTVTFTSMNTTQQNNYFINSFTLDCAINNNVQNPLLSEVRKNIVYNALTNSGMYNWTFVNRTVYRYIDADMYSATRNEGLYNYTITMYMVAPGWSFPGRLGVGSNISIPLAVETYTVTALGTYNDRFDIYIFTPQAMPSNFLNTTLAYCYPSLPTQYNASVYVNYGDVGATYYYNETFFGNYYSAVGKFGGPYDVAIFTNSTDKSTGMYTFISGKNCTTYNISQVSNMSDKYTESIRYLSRGSQYAATSFVNQSMIDGYNVSIWKSSIISGDYFDVVQNKTLTQNSEFYYYWRVVSPTIFVPLKVISNYNIVDANNATNVRSFSIYVEWTSFNIGVQNKTALPANCSASNAVPSISQDMSLPSRNYSPKQITSNSTQAALPSAFDALVEIEYETVQAGSVSSQRYIVQWKYDGNRSADSFIVYNNDGSSYSTLLCWRSMSPPLAYKKNNDNFSYTSSFKLFNPLMQSLVAGKYDGKIGTDIIYNFTMFSKQSKLANPRPTVYGIPVDQWSTSVNGSSSSLLWYPVDWQYPIVAKTQSVPFGAVRVNISINGTRSTETWKFLQFNPTKSGANWTSNCTGAFDGVGGFSSGLTTTAIAVIIVFSSFITILIGALVYVIIRKKTMLAGGKQHPGHILLEEKNESPHQRLQEYNDNEEFQREDY